MVVSSSDGAPSLHDKLKRGLDEDVPIRGPECTTVYVGWVEGFKHNVREFASKNDYWSQTECEMIIVREAISKSREFMRGSKMGWARLIKDLKFDVERRTDIRKMAESRAEGAINDMATMDIGHPDECEYRPKALKKDVEKLETDTYDYGLGQQDRLLIGIASLVLDNQDMFRQSVVDESRYIHSQAESQVESISNAAERYMGRMATILTRASNEENLYMEDFSNTLNVMSENYPDAFDVFMANYDGEVPQS